MTATDSDDEEGSGQEGSEEVPGDDFMEEYASVLDEQLR